MDDLGCIWSAEYLYGSGLVLLVGMYGVHGLGSLKISIHPLGTHHQIMNHIYPVTAIYTDKHSHRQSHRCKISRR